MQEQWVINRILHHSNKYIYAWQTNTQPSILSYLVGKTEFWSNLQDNNGDKTFGFRTLV